MSSIENAHWRDSAREVKFFILDGKTAFPMLLFLMHMRWWTLAVAMIATFFFMILKRYGFTVIVFLRLVRGFLVGSRKMAIPWWEE